MTYEVIQGNNIHVLKTYPDNHFDSIVTDPPYGIDFLGKAWDANTGALETYQECLRVLKPGGHILAFSAARTYHHLAVTLEQAGFEIRDQIMWIYSSGFPKSQDIGKSIDRSANKKDPNYGTTKHSIVSTEGDSVGGQRCKVCNKGVNVNGDGNTALQCKEDPCGLKYSYQTEDGKAWAGWGTALKPAHEPIALARKPIKLSIAKNAQKWGVGALNIDATRIPHSDKLIGGVGNKATHKNFNAENIDKESIDIEIWEGNEAGRFPSNVLGDIPDYQKYFYCPKVSRKERHIGFDLKDVPTIEFNDPSTIHLHPLWTPAMGKNVYRLKQAIEEQQYNANKNIATEASMLADMSGYYIDEQGNETKVNGKNIWLPQTGNIYIHGLKEEYRKWCVVNNKTPNVGNNHPTVKPIELMKYLIKLITPPGGTVLDPFNGSGSTGCAAVELGYNYVGIDLDPKYVEISLKRIEAWNKCDTTFNQLFDL
jgi:site-specific DNA-methyltransferase (adenine-specific)